MTANRGDGKLRAVQRGDLRLKVHVTQGGWTRLLCGRPYGNKYHRELGDPSKIDEKKMCSLCRREYEYLSKLYKWRDEGRDGPRPSRKGQLHTMSGPAA